MPNDHALPTRRDLLAALPAIGLAPSAALAGNGAADPHRRLIAERRRLIEEWKALEEDTPEYWRRMGAWEAKTAEIYSTRATPRDGLIAQVEFFMEDFGTSSDRLEEQFFANLLGSLRRLA